MKRFLSVLLVLAIVASVCAIVPCASAKTYKNGKTYYVYTDDGYPLKLRESPSKTATVITKIPYGDQFVVFETINETWAYGHWGGSFGYVMRRFLVKNKPADKPTPAPSKKTDTEAELKKLNAELKSEQAVDPFLIAVRATRTTGWINFRVGPGSITTRITSLPDGTELRVIGKTNNWYKAELLSNGKIGYIYQGYVVQISDPEEEVAEVPEEGKKNLGKLDVNGEFSLQCELPEGYDLQVINMQGSKIIASVLSEDISKPQLFLSIAFDEMFGDVDRMNDMTEEQLALLENSFTQMNEVEISYRETGYGTKLLVAREVGSDTDFVDILSVYKGYLIEFNMTPNPKVADQQLTDEQIRMCIDFLTNLDFVPAETV